MDCPLNELLFPSTPLYHAICAKSASVTGLLLEARANVNLAQQNGWTPFSKASYDGSIDIMKMLEDAGADIHHRTAHMEQPLYLACQLPSVSILSIKL